MDLMVSGGEDAGKDFRVVRGLLKEADPLSSTRSAYFKKLKRYFLEGAKNLLEDGHDSLALDLLERHDPDVVALQEVSIRNLPVPDFLTERYPYLALSPARERWNERTWGTAFLSRVPFTATTLVPPPEGTDRPVLEVELEHAGSPVVLRNVHPMRPGKAWRIARRNQVLDQLAGLEWGERGILLGDLNTTSTSPAFRDLVDATGLRDSRGGFGRQATWTTSRHLPGLRVDWWSHYAVIILDSPAVAALVPDVVAWLEDRRSPRGVYLCYRPDPRDDRDFSLVEPAPGWVAGHPPAGPVRVTERGMALLVRPGEGPDVGVYVDMRPVRAWLEPQWGGRTVLNTFAYTGAFSVAAALSGASHVTTVDLSSRYLERAEENFVANELDPSLHTFLAEDTFKALDRLRRQGERFDLVVLDPPSFSHSKEGVWSAKRDYPRLVAAACRVLEPGGWLLAATNQGEVSPRDFRGHVVDGARKAGLRGQELFFAGQGPDFPSAAWFPEGRYLKVGIWRMIP